MSRLHYVCVNGHACVNNNEVERQSKQLNCGAGQLFLLKKKEGLPCVGFDHTTLLGECSTYISSAKVTECSSIVSKCIIAVRLVIAFLGKSVPNTTLDYSADIVLLNKIRDVGLSSVST